MIPLHLMALVLKIQKTLIHLHIGHLIIELLKVAPKHILIQAHHPHFLPLVNSTAIGHVSFIFIEVNIGQVLSFRWLVSVEFLKLPSSEWPEPTLEYFVLKSQSPDLAIRIEEALTLYILFLPRRSLLAFFPQGIQITSQLEVGYLFKKLPEPQCLPDHSMNLMTRGNPLGAPAFSDALQVYF